jgi:hypothetical protein
MEFKSIFIINRKHCFLFIIKLIGGAMFFKEKHCALSIFIKIIIYIIIYMPGLIGHPIMYKKKLTETFAESTSDVLPITKDSNFTELQSLVITAPIISITETSTIDMNFIDSISLFGINYYY